MDLPWPQNVEEIDEVVQTTPRVLFVDVPMPQPRVRLCGSDASNSGDETVPQNLEEIVKFVQTAPQGYVQNRAVLSSAFCPECQKTNFPQ